MPNPHHPPRELASLFSTLQREGEGLLEVYVGGEKIETTPEHPFYVREKGWTAAEELEVGDELSTPDDEWLAIEQVVRTGREETLYNLRVADYHTYFVAGAGCGFSVWVHNTYKPPKSLKGMARSEKGLWAEDVGTRALERTGYERLPSKVGSNNGFDGVFVKYGSDGSVLDIIIVESKYSASGRLRLGKTKHMGQQIRPRNCQ